jgi:hypothetical protein
MFWTVLVGSGHVQIMRLLEESFRNALTPEERAAALLEEERLRVETEEAEERQKAQAILDALQRARAYEEAARKANPYILGQRVKGKGVYAGMWRPVERDGTGLEMLYNVFAAPQDLKSKAGVTKRRPFELAAREVASLRGWHGYDGCAYQSDHELVAAIKADEYAEQWFIPTLEILNGRHLNGVKVRDDSLFTVTDTGALDPLAGSQLRGGAWYWSITESSMIRGDRWAVDSASGFGIIPNSSDQRAFCIRPCRAERIEIESFSFG